MLGQVLRVKGYCDLMIHKDHSEGVYGLIDLRLGRTHLKVLAPKSATQYQTWYLGRNLGSREQGAGSREQRAGGREQRAGSRE